MLRLAPLLASLLTRDLGAALRRLRRSALVWALAGLFALAAYAAGLIAAGLALATVMAPAAAALAVGLSQLLLAALALSWLALVNARERRRLRHDDGHRTLATTAALAAALPLLGSRKGLALAALGGLALLLAARRAAEGPGPD